MTRLQYIKMCGNFAKHSLPRLSQNIKDLRGLLNAAGHDVSIQDAYLACEQFYLRFFDDIFEFHYNQVAKFLNDIRWKIFEYLRSEYQGALCQKERPDRSYRYRIPEPIVNPFAQAIYWDLMNRVRGEALHAAIRGLRGAPGTPLVRMCWRTLI